jgi:tetratricopeptide (TPR) repeat protein
MRGDYPRAREHFEHSLRLRTDVDDLAGMAASHNNLGYLWQLQSEYERAIEHYRVAEEPARKINLRFVVIFANLNMAWALISLGAYAEAEARGNEALVLSRQMNDQRNFAQSYDILGLIAARQGQYERALDMYRQELQVHQALGSVPQEGSTLANMAAVFNMQRDFEQAVPLARRAHDTAVALNAKRLQLEAINLLAEAALGMGDVPAGERYAAEAVSLSDSIGSKHDAGIAHRLLGQALAARRAPFAEHFERSIALFDTMLDRFELGRTWAAYADALLQTGNQSDGVAYLKRAKDTFISIGADVELQRLSQIEERSV